MRLRYLKNIFNHSRLARLRQDFANPLKALIACSGIFDRPWKLQTTQGFRFITDRSDLPVWKEYFYQRNASVEIEKDLFQITPNDSSISAYYIKGASLCYTYEPQRWLDTKHPLVSQLESAESSVYSQNGEDGVLQFLVDRLPQKQRFIVEFGAYDGVEMSNSRYWIEDRGWSGYLIESDKRFYHDLHKLYRNNGLIKTENTLVTEENINALFKAAGVPQNFDILSIDIDSIDYYVWQSLTEFSPRIVVIEHNSCFLPPQEYVVPKHRALALSGTSKEGASLQSMYLLGKRKGYHLAYAELSGSNLFFVHESCLPYIDCADITPEDVYQTPQFGLISGGIAPNGRGYPAPS